MSRVCTLLSLLPGSMLRLPDSKSGYASLCGERTVVDMPSSFGSSPSVFVYNSVLMASGVFHGIWLRTCAAEESRTY